MALKNLDPLGTHLVMAHRGASAFRQENTVGAFQLAATLGCDYIELDVRRTLDQALVVHHDAAIPEAELICETPEAKLPQWLPTLRSALIACGSSIINVEIKNFPHEPDHDPKHTMVEPIVALVEDLGLGTQVLFSSFDPGVLAKLAEVAPEMGRAQLMLKVHYKPGRLAEIAERGALTVHLQDILVDAEIVSEAHDLGLGVNVFTVDDPERQLELYAMGVNGICTNAPAELLSLVGRR